MCTMPNRGHNPILGLKSLLIDALLKDTGMITSSWNGALSLQLRN